MGMYRGVTRRGLRRRLGGEPWPISVSAPERGQAEGNAGAEEPFERLAAGSAASVDSPVGISSTAVVSTTGSAVLAPRRGLPRVSGGEPWPSVPHVIPEIPGLLETNSAIADKPAPKPSSVVEAVQGSVSEPVAGPTPLRRGLPRAVDGEPAMGSAPKPNASPLLAPQAPKTVFDHPAAAPTESVDAVPAVPHKPGMPTLGVLPAPSSSSKAPPSEPKRRRSRTGVQWWRSGLLGGGGMLVAMAALVLAARWFVSLDDVQDFLTTYPGESRLPDTASVGIPGWLGWQHYFNTFFMVLIIRTGWQVRTDKRPRVFWTPRWSMNGGGKVSLSLWFHQSLDLLWLINGLVFVVLLFATGQWMRVVPTGWDVIPNAGSAALQYVSLDWPTENGWVNYNSLQVLAYFLTIFIAAPLAAISGVRMSGFWPKNASRLNKFYPLEWARAVHFPVMLYFVVFIVVHVTLVMATGALRNLNHMYGGQDAVNWFGFWVFFGGLVLIVVGWFAARPPVLAPVAQLFGKVSGR